MAGGSFYLLISMLCVVAGAFVRPGRYTQDGAATIQPSYSTRGCRVMKDAEQKTRISKNPFDVEIMTLEKKVP